MSVTWVNEPLFPFGAKNKLEANFQSWATSVECVSTSFFVVFFCPPDMEVCGRSCPMSFCFLLLLDVTMPGDRTPRCQDEERRGALHCASHCHCRQDGSEDEEVRGGVNLNNVDVCDE